MSLIRKVVDVVDGCESRGKEVSAIDVLMALVGDSPWEDCRPARSCACLDRRMTLHAGRGSFIHTRVDLER